MIFWLQIAKDSIMIDVCSRKKIWKKFDESTDKLENFRKMIVFDDVKEMNDNENFNKDNF